MKKINRICLINNTGGGSMKKIFLYAYTEKNLGDDLFIKFITERYPKCRFFIWKNEKTKFYNQYNNLKIVNANSSIYKFFKIIHPSLAARYRNYLSTRCNALVYIGGSIFIEYDNWKTIKTWWDYMVHKIPIFVVGANFGPYKDEDYKLEMGKVFSKCKDVCFRDRYSYELFGNDRVRYAPDILFGYKMPVIKDKEKKVFVSVIDCNYKNEGSNKLSEFTGQYEKFLFNQCQEYIKKGYRIIFSSFCKCEGDEKAADRIYQKIISVYDKKLVEKAYYCGENQQDILKKLASSEIIVATRFHAVVLGLISQCKVLPVLYSDKTKNILKDLKISENIADIRKLDINDIYKTIQLNEIEIRELGQKSKKHFEKLDEYINK